MFIFQVFHHTVPHAPPRIIQLFPTQPLPAPLHRLPNSKGRCPYYYVAVGAAAGPASAGRLPAQSFPYLEHYTDFCASSPAPSSSAFPVSHRNSFPGRLTLALHLLARRYQVSSLISRVPTSPPRGSHREIHDNWPPRHLARQRSNRPRPF